MNTRLISAIAMISTAAALGLATPASADPTSPSAPPAANQPPVAKPTSISGYFGRELVDATDTVLAAASDPEGAPLTISGFTDPKQFGTTVTLNAGRLVINYGASEATTITVPLTVTDGVNTTSTTTSITYSLTCPPTLQILKPFKLNQPKQKAKIRISQCGDAPLKVKLKRDDAPFTTLGKGLIPARGSKVFKVATPVVDVFPTLLTPHGKKISLFDIAFRLTRG